MFSELYTCSITVSHVGEQLTKLHRSSQSKAPRRSYHETINEFGTVLNCMDGRTQHKVADYLLPQFGVRYLDSITTAGTVRHLATDTGATPSLLANLAISVDQHGSKHIAVVAHHDCAGNPVADRQQTQEVENAVERIGGIYPDAEVVGLWIGSNWKVERVR